MEEFKRGDLVEARNKKSTCWLKMIHTGYVIEGDMTPHVCVSIGYEDAFRNGMPFHTSHWRYCRKRQRPKLKIDDPIIVWNEKGKKHKRHFQEWSENGRIVTWAYGRTSWSTYTQVGDSWDYWELLEEKEK